MGGNSTHRMDWISLYPFVSCVNEAYQHRGDTVLPEMVAAGLACGAMIMPGVTIGEGAVVAAGRWSLKTFRHMPSSAETGYLY